MGETCPVLTVDPGEDSVRHIRCTTVGPHDMCHYEFTVLRDTSVVHKNVFEEQDERPA